MQKLLIIIPAYNEAENIVRVVEELKEKVPQYDYVVVNDGSADNTALICKQHGYRMLNLPFNLGLAMQPSRLMGMDSMIRPIFRK